MSETTADRRSFLKQSLVALGAVGAGSALAAGAAQADEADGELDLEAAVQKLLDKEVILAQLSNYQRAMDRCDHELGYGVFWEDAEVVYDQDTLDNGGKSGVDFVDMCLAGREANDLTSSHGITNTLVEIDGDRAGTESYGFLYKLQEPGDGSRTLILGWPRYCDKWEKRNGEWKIVYRISTNDGTVKIPNIAMSGLGDFFEYRRDTDDVSYDALAYGTAE